MNNLSLIDTHSHLYLEHFKEDWNEVLLRSNETCTHIFLPNIDLESIDDMHRISDENPSYFFPMMGLHPCSVKEDYLEVLTKIESYFSQRKYIGVGETGLDYHWDKTFVKEQKESLNRHIEWAKEMDLPLILHCRESMEDVIELVENGQNGRLKGIFHCFGGTEEQAKRIIEQGFLLGIGGVLTYKNTNLRELLPAIELKHLVLETDSPYLTPVPFRGKRNESSYVKYVAEKLAEVKDVTLDELANITSKNALELFGLS